jgi:hypothetical protein
MAQGKKLDCKIESNGIEYEITTKHPIYHLRYTIMTRCYNASGSDFRFYQGRGIKVCDEWKNDFIAFFKWCIDNGWQKGLVLDRINNSKDYTPENCRFITNSENLKKMHKDNVMYGVKASNVKLTEKEVWEIREKLQNGVVGTRLAKDYKVSKGAIYAIKNGSNWKKLK